MKKWKKVLIWVASIIVVLGVGGLFAANYAMDRMIASLANSLETDLVAEVDKGNVEPNDSQTSGEEDSDKDEPVNNQGESTNNGNSGQGTNSTTQPSKQPSNDGYTAEISTDKAKDVQEKITVGEKAQLAGVLLKQLSVDDMKLLQELASGGLNLEEKKEARSIILEKLSPEQYDELIQIAKKYGMSQGKSYEEVIKE
ncbi:hypothetical protein D3P07_25015 [Paenibacillus sp. 1011MAR3C5]|uniref:hypothetical protein n=1 Tax=Paenibacillus sp. 1011MAR3C5 TaxID=1675787 RepID=UPI000E6CDD79|nr:hypothetical protein [Paenibacillus sp. 1011MAR3C5]RJE83615.1 hypothetical protein D3P07_25015 [Paenibacillus sp. 1011MAR3C5]